MGGQYAQRNKNKTIEILVMLWYSDFNSNCQLTHTTGGYERSRPMDIAELHESS